MFFQNVYTLVKETGQKFIKDKAPRLGAALAFYTTLSLAPMLLVVIGIASAVYKGQSEKVGQDLEKQLKETMGDEPGKAVMGMLKANEKKEGNTLATVVGIVTLVLAATGVFAQLQDALNTVWRVEEVKKEGEGGGIFATVWEMIRDRFLSLSMVAGMAFLLLVSTVFGAVVAGFSSQIEQYVPAGGVWLHLLNLTLSTVLTAAMFAMIFKFLPKAHVSWGSVWVGAAVTAVLFNIGKFLISTYLGKAGVASSYGAAGSLILVLLWVYYSTQILLFGAAFTQIYATRFGSGVRTEDGKPIEDGVTKPEEKAPAAKPGTPDPNAKDAKPKPA